jgi:hypothetical protein
MPRLTIEVKLALPFFVELGSADFLKELNEKGANVVLFAHENEDDQHELRLVEVENANGEVPEKYDDYEVLGAFDSKSVALAFAGIFRNLFAAHYAGIKATVVNGSDAPALIYANSVQVTFS